MSYKQEFIRWLGLRRLADKTIRDYTYCFDMFRYPDFDQTSVNEYLSTYKGYIYWAFIKNYKEFLTERYPLEVKYDKIKIPKKKGRKERKLPVYINESDLMKVHDAFDDERNKIMLLIAFYSGARPQGLLAITGKDIDWQGFKTNPGKPVKLKLNEKGNKERVVFVPYNVVERLRKWIIRWRSDRGVDFKLWAIGHNRWDALLRDASKKALGYPLSPHKIRHSCATWLLDNGWDLLEIKNYLGHESINTTQIYAHLDKKKIQEKYASLFE